MQHRYLFWYKTKMLDQKLQKYGEVSLEKLEGTKDKTYVTYKAQFLGQSLSAYSEHQVTSLE